MLLILKKMMCGIKGHTLKMAGSCPFTGKTYNYCDRCTQMFPIVG
jgi:hypothetical protein